MDGNNVAPSFVCLFVRSHGSWSLRWWKLCIADGLETIMLTMHASEEQSTFVDKESSNLQVSIAS